MIDLSFSVNVFFFTSFSAGLKVPILNLHFRVEQRCGTIAAFYSPTVI